jgi:MoaA/NifB/PqqE/SkfB family radical SAM enzyme
MVDDFDKNTSNAKYKLTLARFKLIDTPFIVYMLGGEPTLHPHINEIIKVLDNIPNCIGVEFNTNLSRSLKFLNSIYTSDKMSIRASYHPEYYDQRFLDKAIALKDKDFSVHINITDDPDDWPLAISLVESLKAEGVSYYFNRLYSTDNREINYDATYYDLWEPYFKEVNTYLHDITFKGEAPQKITALDLYRYNLDNYKGFLCHALMYNIDIDGHINNICTGESLPLVVKKEDTHRLRACPLTSCNCDIMFDFYKEPI